MPFPITYNGRVNFKGDAIAELTPEILLEKLETGLRERKATNVFRNAMTLSFSGGILSLATNWNLLSGISSGEIQIESTDKTISVIYRLRFTVVLICFTLLVVYMWRPFTERFPCSAVESVFRMFLIWGGLFGITYLWAVARFSLFIRNIGETANRPQDE